ncbi:MAG: glutamine hydrolyzing CTP synthase [Nanoarchaeota archaeon]
MNPVEHGEVFVLDDGGEVDMDFGHYERFLQINCKSCQNLTMGKIFHEIRNRERRGDYLGKTVQFVPHVTDLIKEKFFALAEQERVDILLIEVGGTVGDIENELYIQAVRELKEDIGSENIVYVHLTYIPVPGGVNEQKTKPTQQSVKMLTERGIQPDVIIGRCEEKLDDKVKEKIARFCGVRKEAVISGEDVSNIYKIPIIFDQQGLSEILHRKLQIYSPPDLREWKQLADNLENLNDFNVVSERADNSISNGLISNLPINKTSKITVAICGKYTDLEDSYASINEALMHCGAHCQAKIKIKFIEATEIETGESSVEKVLKDVDAVVVPGGFGQRGIEGKIEVIRYCRVNNLPFLGICLGLQLAVIEYARNVCGLKGANSSEIDQCTLYPVIDILPEQKAIEYKGGTMRLGAYKAILKEGSIVRKMYACEEVWERHRHRYEVNPDYHQILTEKGLLICGFSPDGKLAEFIELPGHKYFVATQAHPELKSRLTRPAPLFRGLVRAALMK